MRTAVLIPTCCLLAVGVGLVGLQIRRNMRALSQRDGVRTTQRDQDRGASVEIPSIDWAAVGAWARDNLAVKDTEGEWVGLDEFLRSLDAFLQATDQPVAEDAIDEEHLRLLMQGMKQWNSAEAERPSLLWSAILEASREPEVWGRLMRALGPGLMAGAYEFRIENRPELVETMRQVRIELESAEGEARLKLEAELEELQEAISAIDRIPVPSTPARKTWEMLRPLLEKISDAEAEAEGPATD